MVALNAGISSTERLQLWRSLGASPRVLGVSPDGTRHNLVPFHTKQLMYIITADDGISVTNMTSDMLARLLSDMPTLQELCIVHSPLVSLKRIVQPSSGAAMPGWCQHLTRLTIRYSQLELLPRDVNLLAGLQRLEVSHNSLEEIPATIGDLVHLEHLNISDNQLTRLPCQLGRLARLTELFAYSNQLASVPDTLADLHSLRYLNHVDNPPLCLQSIPAAVRCLPRSRSLRRTAG